MKVLIVFNDIETDNLFVHLLAKGIREVGVDVCCSTDKFWNDHETKYDIVHFQWPEEVVGWSHQDEQVILQLRERVDELRANGVRFVYTRHNTHPHYVSKIIGQAYDIIESCSDTVVHMGQFSYDDFAKRYPDKRNVLIPHHIYEDTYREDITREEARAYLKIPAHKFVITAFGKFRNNQEIRMMLSAFFKADVKGKLLLAPRLLPFSRQPWQRNFIKRMISKLGYYTVIPFMRLWNIRAGSNEEIVSDHDLPYYIAASNVVVVQRKHILNSGNIPLGFLFHKIVIGPDCGNVGELLRLTGNPVFNADDTNSIADAIKQTFSLENQGQGEKNYSYACEQMGLKRIAALYKEAYTVTLYE